MSTRLAKQMRAIIITGVITGVITAIIITVIIEIITKKLSITRLCRTLKHGKMRPKNNG
jgi:hypothetical protein